MLRLKISAKLACVVAAALVALCATGVVAVLATRDIADQGHMLYVEASRFARLDTSLATLFERVFGDVRSVPSELDLTQLKSRQQNDASLLAEARRTTKEAVDASATSQIAADGTAILANISAYEAAANKVFEFALAFAQPQAIEQLRTAVAPAELQLQAASRKLRDDMEGRSSARVAAMEANVGMVGRLVGLLSVVLVVGVVIVSYFVIARGVARPVTSLAAIMGRLSGGDNQVAIPFAGRHDEIGEMAKAVSVFRQNAIERARLEDEQTQQQGRAAREKSAALIGMADKIETETSTALESVGARTNAMAATAEAMTASASRTSTSAQAAATASAHSLANAQTVASAAEELSASIREIGAQVDQSSAIVGRAVAAGSETRATIEALNEQVGRIGAVADMIGEIAARTNLLALNATIEAARAGDAGKGFAVVAAEVKALATQTARATQEIAQHIVQVRSATGVSVAAVARIERTIGEVNAIASSIAAAVEQQGAATAEIARNVSETASAANEMTGRATEVTTEAEQTGKHAADVRENAAALNSAVRDLRHAVIHVVRTSTTEVDRRRAIRHQVDLPCRLSLPGQAPCTARVTDISEGGASVRGGPSLHPGTHGALHLDGVGFALPCSVHSSEDDTLHLVFELDETARAKFQPILELFARSRAA